MTKNINSNTKSKAIKKPKKKDGFSKEIWRTRVEAVLIFNGKLFQSLRIDRVTKS